MLIPARDVREAVALAEDFKARGTYDWFRGQVRNWTLISSLNRRTDHDAEMARVRRFLGWTKVTQGVEHLAADLDASIAVAQHYGLGTHFIDFTTEPSVAGYFATEGIEQRDPAPLDLEAEERRFFGGEPPSADVGVILCLDRERLMDVWDVVASRFPPEAAPEFLELDVPDLWRLEGQRGVFLFCPAKRFEEVVLDLDRIVFPHTGPVGSPAPDTIYPTRKSALERLLDEYFQLEIIAANPLEGMFPKGLFTNVMRASRQEVEEDQRYLSQGRPTDHPSWAALARDGFLRPAAERFLTIGRTAVPVAITDASPRGVAAAVEATVRNALALVPEHRERFVEWTIVGADPRVCERLGAALASLFDAMRGLPTTDAEIARATGSTAGLLATASPDGWQASQRQREAAEAWFGAPVVSVEWAADNDAYGRGLVARASLLAAFRPDLVDCLNEAGRAYYGEYPERLLSDIGRPEALFPLEAFRSLFYGEALPSLIAFRPDLPVMASFPRIRHFGLA